MEVNNLNELVKQFTDNGNEVISCDSTNLLANGENYGSILLSVKIKLRSEDGEERMENWVAKITPPTQFLWDFFNTTVTFKKEVGVYKEITSALNKFGEEKGIKDLIDFFPAYHGSRLSLDPQSKEVDGDAVLLLENLKVKGYSSKDRFVGLNLEYTKSVLNDLAAVHAATIAFKFEKPEEFKKNIRPFLDRDFFFDTEDEQMIGFIDTLKSEAAAANPDCAQFFPKLEERMLAMKRSFREPLDSKEPFATFNHGDLWVNNVMHIEDGGIRNKMFDFQLIEYNSPANDVIFFLYSSVQLEVLEKRVDEFLELYYSYFIDTLKELECDVSPFSYEVFLEECAEMAYKLQFSHLCFMHIPMFTQKGKAKELSEWSTKDLVASKGSLHPIFGKRLQFILTDFAKRGWI